MSSRVFGCDLDNFLRGMIHLLGDSHNYFAIILISKVLTYDFMNKNFAVFKIEKYNDVERVGNNKVTDSYLEVKVAGDYRQLLG